MNELREIFGQRFALIGDMLLGHIMTSRSFILMGVELRRFDKKSNKS